MLITKYNKKRSIRLSFSDLINDHHQSPERSNNTPNGNQNHTTIFVYRIYEFVFKINLLENKPQSPLKLIFNTIMKMITFPKKHALTF